MFEIKINGKKIRQFVHGNNNYVEGRTGTEYTIEVTNDHYSRRLFVVSVDGINIISGKTAEADPYNGYVIGSHETINLKGYRINNEEVAAFKFVDSKQSYAKGITGSKKNNGVIGVKVYDEKYIPYINKHNNWTYPWKPIKPEYPNHPTPIWKDNFYCGGIKTDLYSHGVINTGDKMDVVGSSCNASSMDCGIKGASNNMLRSMSMDSKPAEFNLGTGWGGKQTQKVQEVNFEVGNLLYTELVYYASREELVKMGVDMGNTKKIRTLPSAFGEQKFCPVPKGWNG